MRLLAMTSLRIYWMSTALLATNVLAPLLSYFNRVFISELKAQIIGMGVRCESRMRGYRSNALPVRNNTLLFLHIWRQTDLSAWPYVGLDVPSSLPKRWGHLEWRILLSSSDSSWSLGKWESEEAGGFLLTCR